MKNVTKNIIFLILLLFIFTGCSGTSEEDNKDKMNQKALSELQYVEDDIFNITNKYAKGEYIKDDELDWNAILEDEKKINEVLETIILDLTEVNISKEDLVTLSAEFNNLLTITIAKNEPELLPRLQNVYSLVPKYLNQFSDNKSDIKDKELKSIVLSSYAFANNDDWEQAKSTIQTGIDKYNEMMNDVSYVQEKSYSLNRVYVLLGEVKNAIDVENLELLKLKYVNFIEKL